MPGHEVYKGKLVIPYLTRNGIVDIRFRSVPSDGDPSTPTTGAKYLSLPGATPRPFNALALSRPEQFVVICEGEFDTMIAHQCGIPAIGFPGVEAWEKYYWRMLRYRRVAILADQDDKGQGMKFAEKIQASAPGAVVIRLPEGYDVNSFVSEFGEDELRKKVGLK